MIVIANSTAFFTASQSGLTHLDDFHHKMRKTDRHCERSEAIQKSARF
jgi:hypothetical protein